MKNKAVRTAKTNLKKVEGFKLSYFKTYSKKVLHDTVKAKVIRTVWY